MPTRPKTHAQRMRDANPHLQPRDNRTLTASQRGYDGRWQKASKSFLGSNPLCLYCTRRGLTTPATLVDHNPPHRGDMKQFWNVATWTPACKECHDFITPKYDGGGGRPIRPRDGVYVAPQEGEVRR